MNSVNSENKQLYKDQNKVLKSKCKEHEIVISKMGKELKNIYKEKKDLQKN
jgi:hypothetical protein